MNNIVQGVTNRMALPLLKVQKHSPALLFAGGVAGVVATVVMASRATLKMNEVLEEHEKNLAHIDEAAAIDEKYGADLQLQKKDKVAVFVKTSLNVARLYGPAVIVGTASIAALTGSHVILTNRVSGLTAAYATLDRAFRSYRKRVVTEYGKDKDDELFFGTEITETEVEGPEGVKKTKKVKSLLGPNGYAVCFDESNPNWKRGPGYNVVFIRGIQNMANDILNAKGYLFLNDVYEMLGFERTPAGQRVGWLKDGITKVGDGYVDFGVLKGDYFNALRFVKGDELSVWLDFNVDGEIWDEI